MSFIFELVGELLSPVPDIGGRKRRREREAMWHRRDFPTKRRPERFSTWIDGTGHAEPGRLTFSSTPQSSHTLDVKTAAIEGKAAGRLQAELVQLPLRTRLADRHQRQAVRPLGRGSTFA